MTYFGDQLKKRREHDRKTVEMGERTLGKAVGRKKIKPKSDMHLRNDEKQVASVCEFLKIVFPDEIRTCRDLNELIEVCLRPSGAQKRRVKLSGNWHKDADGPMIATLKKDGSAIALFPCLLSGLYYVDSQTGKKVRVTANNKDMFDELAYSIYKPLPEHVRTGKDYMRFLIGEIRKEDVVVYALSSFVLALVWSLPTVTMQLAFSRIIPTRQESMLVSLMIMLISVAIGDYLLRTIRISYNLRMQNRLNLISQSCVYSRVLNLPSSFFAGQTAGGLSQRIAALNKLPECIGDMLYIITNSTTALISAAPMLFIAPQLVTPILAIMLILILLIMLTIYQEKKLTRASLEASQENGGLVFDIISGIQRIRISGGEDRAYAKWLRTYSKVAGTTYALLFPLYIRPQMINIIRLCGILWGFLIAYHQNMSVAQFAAFTTAYGILFGSIKPMITKGQSLAQIKPIIQSGELILKAEPENNKDKLDISKLDGGIELNHITFRYEENQPAIWDDLNIKIKPGEYVALVGKSGCGKSTLVKLLLGFAKPEAGGVFYDGTDLETIDPRSLRKCIGTVLQDDKLFAGDLYSNITISAPWLGVEDAWEAAEKAGIADYIRDLPMGMDTMLSEGGGGISGGQRQRLLIARAIAPKPSVLIFDEATSALDNITQKAVTKALDELKCTRIVIAHRLSTIRECDRIIALDKGKVVETGTYDELVKKGGFFADLVARQQIDSTPA